VCQLVLQIRNTSRTLATRKRGQQSEHSTKGETSFRRKQTTKKVRIGEGQISFQVKKAARGNLFGSSARENGRCPWGGCSSVGRIPHEARESPGKKDALPPTPAQRKLANLRGDGPRRNACFSGGGPRSRGTVEKIFGDSLGKRDCSPHCSS